MMRFTQEDGEERCGMAGGEGGAKGGGEGEVEGSILTLHSRSWWMFPKTDQGPALWEA